MTRRRRETDGGGVRAPSLFDRMLSRHIKETLNERHTDTPVEELVHHLRSMYPRYNRYTVQDLSRRVNRIKGDSDCDNDKTMSTKKRRKIDVEHMKRRSSNVVNNSSGSSCIASTASSGSSSKADDSSDKEASKELRSKNGQEPLELEVVENKYHKTLCMVNDGGKQAGVGGGDGLSEFNRKNSNESIGPMFKDLGGMAGVIEELNRDVIEPLYNLQLYRHLGVKPMAGILLHGPPGCGKTKLAHAIANETKVPFYKISATELVSGVSGASEENIRELFAKAYRTAPSIVFIDEIDSIASKRENLQREMERRIVTQLMTCMDESHRTVKPVDAKDDSDSSDHKPGHVLVIGATNRPDAIDRALRRPGRFEREIVLGVPDEKARVQILSVLVSNLRIEGEFDLLKVARSTPGFVGADMVALANKAGNLAIKRIIEEKVQLSDIPEGEDSKGLSWSNEEMEKLSITMADFEEAVKYVQPSSRREGFSTVPNVKWDDVGGLHLLRQEFDRYIVRRIKYPEVYKDFGVDLETGFLLYGPPGCGKTLIAKAVANEAGANFIHIKGPEILNKYVGESELVVRTIFSRARTCSPCILFFDEVDALTTKRGKEGGWVVERLLNQLLIELDGADQRRDVFVIRATNRPEVMDRAVLRPGRFGKLLYVPLPTPDERGMILKALALAGKKPVDKNIDLMAIGKDSACENLSGADLCALINEAAMIAIDEILASFGRSSNGTTCTIKDTHFKRALETISPSVSNEQKQYYQQLSESFKAA